MVIVHRLDCTFILTCKKYLRFFKIFNSSISMPASVYNIRIFPFGNLLLLKRTIHYVIFKKSDFLFRYLLEGLTRFAKQEEDPKSFQWIFQWSQWRMSQKIIQLIQDEENPSLANPTKENTNLILIKQAPESRSTLTKELFFF